METDEPQLSDAQLEYAIEAAFADHDYLGMYFLEAVRTPLLKAWQDTLLAQIIEPGQLIARASHLSTVKGKPLPFYAAELQAAVQQVPGKIFDELGALVPHARTAKQHAIQLAAMQENWAQAGGFWQVNYTDQSLEPLKIDPLPHAGSNGFNFYTHPGNEVILQLDEDSQAVTFQSEQITLLQLLAGLERSMSDQQLSEQLLQMLLAAENARNYMAKANTRLVISNAKHQEEPGISFADLIQEGNVGLLAGTEKYDYRLGTRASTYLTWWIRQRITRAKSQQADTIRRPMHVIEDRNYYRKLRGQLTAELNHKPDYQELAEHADKGHTPIQIQGILEFQQPESLDEPVSDEAESDTRGDLLEDAESQTEEQALGNVANEQLAAAIDELIINPRNRRVLKLRYGLDPTHFSYGTGMTLEELANEFGLSRERIRQLEAAGLRAMRHPKNRGRFR